MVMTRLVVKKLWCVLSLSLFISSACLSAEDQRPNILLIVADDLGYADLGSFGSEIETPNLDRLAEQGVKLLNLYSAPACSPTRSMLLTGADNHLVGLGNMAEELSPNQVGQPGYEGYLNTAVTPISSLLQASGYNTYMVGKWHLGLGENSSPTQHGFDRSFAMLSGGASHYSDMRPAYAKSPESKAPYRKDGKLLQQLPPNFKYSSQFYVDELMAYLKTDQHKQPFFAYLSFTAPHWPLQAPQAAIKKYQLRYLPGYDRLHAERLERQKKLGLIPANATGPKRPSHLPAWDNLSAAEQQASAKSMAVYAAMVDEMDRHTGRLLAYLENQGQLDNTVVVFVSDNGAEGHDLDQIWPKNAYPKINQWVVNNHDFSLAAMGRPGSYTLYGEGWARAGSPAFSGYKGYPQEGGIHVPGFVYHPAGFRPSASAKRLSMKDIAVSILALGQLSPSSLPADQRLKRTGKPKLLQLEGPDSGSEIIAGELFGKQAIQQAGWKAVKAPKPIGNGQWQLFNLNQDVAEQHDLAADQPEKLQQLKRHMAKYRETNNVILPDWVSGY